jgi:2-polyprenyl-3-methyl-5-hydroxy-6-metoxy-1,4-benzoquinol methylase
MEFMATATQTIARISSRNFPCDLCGSREFETVATADRDNQPLTTVVCRRCGLVSHEEIPSEEDLAEFYGRRYRQAYHGEVKPSAKRVVRAWETGEALLRRLARFVKPGANVFEIGAGIGCNVKVFDLAGYNASGVEPNHGFCHYSQQHLKTKVRNQSLEDCAENGAFDLVILVHVIEHLRSPAAALKKIHGMLRPGGHLHVECPNLAGHSAPGKQFHFAHIYNFTAPTLRMLAGKCGFGVAHNFDIKKHVHLRFLLRKIDDARFDLDESSYDDTIAALSRQNTVSYHTHPGYLKRRLKKALGRVREQMVARRRLREILAACQST